MYLVFFSERVNPSIIFFRYPVWEDSHRCISERNDFTDDTDQLLLMLQSLQQTADGILHPLNFAKKMAEWNDFGFPELGTPARGIGYTVGQVLGHNEFRTNPHKAAFVVRVPCFSPVYLCLGNACSLDTPTILGAKHSHL